MPFDCVLYDSRVMVAKGADRSPSVQQLIDDTPGVDHFDWEGTYDKPTGGILTFRSELGEPIHKIATRGVKLWREFDDTVFPQQRDTSVLLGFVIGRLNKDYMKPWFGEKADGPIAFDLHQMTYEEITSCMVRLVNGSRQSR